MSVLTSIALLAVIARLASLGVSINNEKRLKALGAQEFGAGTSRVLAMTHTFFYLAAMVEGLAWRHAVFDKVSIVGLLLYALGMFALLLVLLALGRQWTVKIMVSPGHHLVLGGIYRYFRHPNYVCNLVPELVGFALCMHGYYTLMLGLPVYAFILLRRISEEDAAMQVKFAGY